VQVLHDYLVLSRRGLERDLRAIGGETDNLAMAELARHVAIRLDAGGRAPASASTHAGPALPLSPREHSILQLLAMGKTNKDIARELSVTPETVKTHMKRMFGKLNVSTRAQAVSKFLQADPPRFPSGAGPLR
jgi:DNA-binding NarL/FixJ family response regulator